MLLDRSSKIRTAAGSAPVEPPAPALPALSLPPSWPPPPALPSTPPAPGGPPAPLPAAPLSPASSPPPAETLPPWPALRGPTHHSDPTGRRRSFPPASRRSHPIGPPCPHLPNPLPCQPYIPSRHHNRRGRLWNLRSSQSRRHRIPRPTKTTNVSESSLHRSSGGYHGSNLVHAEGRCGAKAELHRNPVAVIVTVKHPETVFPRSTQAVSGV
jgi:hypothetical protein